MMAFSRNLLSAKANQAAGLAAQNGGNPHSLLLLPGVAMSKPGPPVQEEEDDGGEDNGHDGHQGHGEKIHKLHNCVLKSRVTTVESINKQGNSVG
jgi:hypothetical protein